MKVGCLFSGGKDSIYALFLAQKKYDVKCLITLNSKNPDSYMFHTININLVKKQAKILGLPLIFFDTLGKKEKELIDLKRAVKKAIEKYDIEALISGGLASTYQKKRIDKICKELGIKHIAPLWGKNMEIIVKKMIKLGFKIFIIVVAADGLDKSWLGRKLDLNSLDELKKISEKYGFNLFGEGGDIETIVLSGPNFEKSLKIKKAVKIMENECTGKFLIRLVD